MDLKNFYFQNIQDSEYHYRFCDSITNLIWCTIFLIGVRK